MKIINYPDKTSYAKVDDFKNFTFRVNSYEDLWHLNQIIDVYNNNGFTPTITIPNLIDAQADRRFNSDESSGLKLVCNFLNNMKANFRIFHPHNPEVVEALMDNVEIIDNSEFINRVIDKINDRNYADLSYDITNPNLVLLSSDAGGFKPLMKLCDKIKWEGETLSASKSRSYNPVTNKSELVQILNIKDLQGKDVLIIDDICVYGGTFKGLSKLLKTKNCGKLYLAVSHMTVQDLGEDSVTNYFDNVFTTNSKHDNYIAKQFNEDSMITFTPNNLTIINLF